MKRLGTLQFSFLFLNVLFWAVGIGIVGFVSWTLSSLPSNTEFLSVAFAFLYVILFLGLVIAATGLLGCLGGLFRSICLLKLYIGLMVAFVFVEVAIAIGAYTQKDQIPTLITSTWPQLNNDTKFTLQAGLECCGVNNYTEYGAHLADLPLSCFKVYDTLTVHTKSWTLLFTTPCLQQLQHWFDANLPIWATILILICLIQFMSMGLGVGVMVGIEERTKVHPTPDPPDEEQPADGTTIVCSESPHPQSSRMSEFSDQQSLSSASGDTTARKLSQVPEEEEDYLSSGVVCCDSKDDLSITRSRASSLRHVVTEPTEETGDGKDEVHEEEVVTSEGPSKSEDPFPSHGGLLVAYSEETKRYENQPTPEANGLDSVQSKGRLQNNGEDAAQQEEVRGRTASPISSQRPEDRPAGDRDDDNIDDVTTGKHVEEGRMGIQAGLEEGVQFQENDAQHKTLESHQLETSKDIDKISIVPPSESQIKKCELQEENGDKSSNKNLKNHQEVTLCREGTFDISKDENRASQNQ